MKKSILLEKKNTSISQLNFFSKIETIKFKLIFFILIV